MPPAHGFVLEQHQPEKTSVLPSIIAFFLILAVGGVWLILRNRRTTESMGATESLILESEITIEIGDDIFEIEYLDDDSEQRPSMETLLTSPSPQRLTFAIDKLPLVHIENKSNTILQRRGGKKTLKLQPPETGEADMVFLDVKDGKLTLSPFSSRKDGSRAIPAFPPTRKRTPRTSELMDHPLTSVMTAPRHLEKYWRPLDTAELQAVKM